MPKDKRIFLRVLIDPILLKRIDDFRFLWRFQSRSTAIKWLLNWALGKSPQPPLEHLHETDLRDKN